ncbi:MAG: DNA polymerase III subunit gamma/tau [Vulcanimicrobiaceae bacterium]
MSLYRTWRPASFADLVGQDAVVRTLASALGSGKLAHAYLFSGPRGSGKTSAAKILARCVNCVNGPTAAPDNSCPFCLSMLAGTALDVLEIDAASNRGIDEIRALRDAVKFAPAAMRMKIYIIDEAHMLTKEGANAFLKTLEEPPAHALFILATTEPEKLPVTILSRCQRYAFRRIPIPVMIERMETIARAEQIPIEAAALAAIAYRADGGLRDALTMLEQVASFADPGASITAATLDLAFGATGRNFAGPLMDALLAEDAGQALRLVDEAADAGADMLVLGRALIAEFRNVLVARIDPELLARDLAPQDAARASERAPAMTQATGVRALRLLADAVALARNSGNPRLELETALLRFVLAGGEASPPAPSPAPTPARPASSVRRAPSPHAEPMVTAPAPRSGEVTLQRVRAGWKSIRGKVESERQSLRAPLSRAQIDGVERGAVILKLPDSWSHQALRDHLPLLESAIADVLGAAMRVQLVVESGVPAPPRAQVPRAEPDETSSAAANGEDGAEDATLLLTYLTERIPEA